MQRLIWTIIAAFAMTLVCGPIMIPWLKKLKFGQTIYDLGPESHKKKQGTPTMGGIIFAIPALIAALAFAYNDTRFDYSLMILISALGFGLIGFVDDFIKVKLKRSLGLTPMQKIVPQLVISVALAIWAYNSDTIGSSLTVPFFNVEWNLGWFYIPVMVFVMVGTVNSANLLDGLDGLLSGCSMINFITMMIICLCMAAVNGANSSNLLNTAIFAAAMAGTLMGFLRFNAHPARVFMGDVGSFFIGGALVGMTTVTRLSLLLPIIAIAMFASSVSDIIQVGYFKYTKKKYGAGRRVFKMAPLHHHFELSGMPETRVVTMYYITTAGLCLLALLGFVA
ncbi:MAG: phospho-N-acetylmuramoyl-pentapeptide-transferase [Clostridia bacterium]|nr:phospho-N-acetylmuramoyl-pentapeptide-transferase [Clostridia bacterium]